MSDLIDRQPEKRTIKRTETRACDCISREAAIDELDKGAWGVEWDKTLAKTMIESLPSAQPTQNTRVNSNNALDTISRQAALDALGEKPLAWMESEYEQGLQNQWVWDVNALKALPSAQPERKTGKWIIKDNPGTGWYRVTCSECGEDVTSTAPCIGFYPNAKVTWDYCPNCGADMREVDDERPD